MWESTRYQNNGIRWKIESTLDVLDYAGNICLISPLIKQPGSTKHLEAYTNLKKNKIIRITRNNNSVQVNGELAEDVDTITYMDSMDIRRYGRGNNIKKN